MQEGYNFPLIACRANKQGLFQMGTGCADPAVIQFPTLCDRYLEQRNHPRETGRSQWVGATLARSLRAGVSKAKFVPEG